MSSMFSKNREKRSRSATSESNSFVKNVTSRVSGLLPATITKWFSSPSSSANGSAAAVEGSDSSTEEEGPDSPVAQPPSKRMRLSPGSFAKPAETPASTTESMEVQTSQLYESIQAPSSRATFRKEPNYGSAPLISPEDISSIEVVKMPRRDKEFKVPHSVTTSSPSVAAKRKSIFESTGVVKDSLKPCNETSKDKPASKPSFKPAYFGSPFYPGRTMYGGASTSTFINHPNIKQRKTATVRETQKNNEMVNMSFAARRVMDLLENYSSPLSEAKRIPIMRKADLSHTLDNSTSPTTSHGYSYKTQELHIPSIASIMRVKQRARIMDTTKAARQIIASHSSTLNSTFSPYGIDLPKSDASKNIEKENTTKMKTRLTRPNRGEDPLEMPEPVQIPTAVLKIDNNNLPKFSFSGPSSTQTSSTSNQMMFGSFSSSSMGSQPTNTSMSLPLFTMSSMNTQSSLKPDENMFDPQSVKSLISSTPKISSQAKASSEFKFSRPVTISTETHQNTAIPKFKFGTPVDLLNKPVKRLEMATSSITSPLPLPKSTSAGWKCSECWIVNKEEAERCASCTTKRPSKENAGPSKSKCSMCKLADSQLDKDKCANCEKVQMNKSGSLLSATADPTKWKCGDCWVSNNANVEKCACCGSRNPNNAAPAPAAAKATAKAEADWKCEDCWILNKSSVEKCAACGGAKPGTKTSAASAPLPAFNSPFARAPDKKISEIVKTQTDKWECPSCLVRNESNKSLCVCCGMERPGPAKKLASKPTFSFGTVSNTTFKFGIDPKVQEANLENKKEETKKEPTIKLEEPETNNNTVSKIPTFSFGKKSEDKLANTKPTEAPKTTFSFGIPKTAAAISVPALVSAPAPVSTPGPAALPAPAPTPAAALVPAALSVPTPAPAHAPALVPTFGVKLTPLTAAEEKPQEVPKVDLSAPKALTVQSFAGFFAAPKITNAEASKSFSSFITSTPMNEKKEASPFSFSTNVIASTGSSNFTFNSGGIKSTPMFGNQASGAASTSTISFGMPQAAPTTTTAPTLMFKKPETQPTLAMFQPSEPAPANTMFNAGSNPVPTAAPAAASAPAPAVAPAAVHAPAPAAPLFSFGNNTATQPAVDKPKFNFSFGSNPAPSAEPFTSFKPPVFGQTETAPCVQPFGAINPLGGSTVTPRNGINENTMGGNTMSSNPMGGTEQTAPMFGAPSQGDNLWGANNNNNSGNLFGNASQKSAPFTFGTPNPFNGGQPQQQAAGGGGASQAPMFGAQSPPSSNMFGNGSMFSSPAASSSAAPSLFGAQSPAPSSGMFAAPAAPVPSFDPPQSQQQPAFNFGAPQASGVFGFGAQQGQQQQSQPQPGVYSFGGGMSMGAPGMGMGSPAMGMGSPAMGNPAMGSPAMGVQFNMGSAPTTNVRRMRKAVRRNPQR